MTTIHCLAYSRALRLVWLMEDLGEPYDLVQYERTAKFRAPDSLAKVHPLGKSPVLEDDGLVLAESATCLRYLADKHDDATHYPPEGTLASIEHEELFDYVESSFAGAAMGLLLPTLHGKEPSEQARAEMKNHVDYVTGRLPAEGLLFGDTAMLADIQFSYLLANLAAMGFLSDAPRLASYWDALQAQPGYRAAIAKAGPMAPPR